MLCARRNDRTAYASTHVDSPPAAPALLVLLHRHRASSINSHADARRKNGHSEMQHLCTWRLDTAALPHSVAFSSAHRTYSTVTSTYHMYFFRQIRKGKGTIHFLSRYRLTTPSRTYPLSFLPADTSSNNFTFSLRVRTRRFDVTFFFPSKIYIKRRGCRGLGMRSMNRIASRKTLSFRSSRFEAKNRFLLFGFDEGHAPKVNA